MALEAGYTMKIDTDTLSESLLISPDECMDAFSDGRVISRFSEYWVCKALGFTKHSNTNHKSSDAHCNGFEISIRSLTKNGIRFQDSRFIGAGRTCSRQDLIDSVEATDRWAVCDINDFPYIHIYQLRSMTIRQWVTEGEVTPSGLTPSKFVKLMNRDQQQMMRLLC
jgi:hypothetical protein